MDILKNVTKATLTNAHGEVNFLRIDEGEIGGDWSPFTDFSKSGGVIVGHSEQGHHHVLERGGVSVEQTESNGFRILKAIVTTPTALRQEAGVPHAPQIVEPGTYIITNSIEKPFFQEQARRVAD